MYTKRVKIFTIIVFSLLSFLFLCLLLFFVSYSRMDSKRVEELKYENKRLLSHEYTSSHSNFGNTLYECSSLCYCDDDDDALFNKRRSAGSILSSSSKIVLRYAVLAISSVTALKVSRDYFRVECEEKLSDFCSLESIISGDDECDVKIGDELVPLYDDLLDESPESMSVENFNGYYVCRGHCLFNFMESTDDDDPDKKLNDKKKKLLNPFCDNFVVTQYLHFDFDTLYGNRVDELLEFYQSKNLLPSETASVIYAQTHLDQHCRENSRGLNELDLSEDKINKINPQLMDFLMKKRDFPFCVGLQVVGDPAEGGYNIHEKTKCKKVNWRRDGEKALKKNLQ